MSEHTVVVVGSLHHDIMVEAPRMPVTGETLAGKRWYAKFGGKGGNQALAVRQAGAKVRMLGAVGCDNFGDFLLEKLSSQGVAINHIERLNNVGSGMSVAHIDDEGDYGAVIVSGANLHIDISRLNDPLLWQEASLLLLQNEVPESVNLAAARAAKKAGLDVCLNAAPARDIGDELASLIDVLVVNAIEADALAGVAVHSLDNACKAAEALSTEFPKVVVTAGGHGAAIAQDDQAAQSIEPIKVDVVSTHGAGDLFTGTLCVALVNGDDLLKAARLANAAAAQHVSLSDLV
jgi:ribokinase